MASATLRRIRAKIWPEPLPAPGTFDGQTVLITGATSGLGLAAAKHFASLGATIIITSRSVAKGEPAKRDIEQSAGVAEGRVHLMELDMSRYSSCRSFINELKGSKFGRRGINVAVLNAGIINSEYAESPEGWEQTIQVNTISTTLLGLLLLEWMKTTRATQEQIPHLVVVASRDHLDPDISCWADWAAHEGILRHLSNRENWPKDQVDPNYANSKLMLMYAIEHMCEKTLSQDGKADVIINSVCPGLVYTDIARSVVKSSVLMKVVIPLYLGILGKSADYGARFYVTAALTSQDQHGKYIQGFFADEEEYSRSAFPNMKSETAKRAKALVLEEILAELGKLF